MTILAKKDKTLKDHLSETLSIAKRIIPETDDETLRKAALFATAFHDIGKADISFQRYIRGKSKKAFPHPLIGLSLVDYIATELGFKEPYKSLILLAVASHHSPITARLYHDKSINLSFNVSDENLPELIDTVNFMVSELGYGKKFDTLPKKGRPKVNYECAREQVFSNRSFEGRFKFMFIQGVLMQSDYFASAEKDIIELRKPEKFVDSPYDYQRLSSQIDGNLFIILPTGTGKTETALYWAKKNLKKKLFYVLPTTTTINAMFDRLKRYFGEEQTALYHSYVDMYFYLEKGEVDEENYENLLFYKYFLYPINVTTPDQLILSMMNYKRYTLKNFSLLDATLIFDEIHTYDAETFFLIKYLLKFLDSFRARICVMSATFPEKFKEELSFLGAKILPNQKEMKRIYNAKKRTIPKYIDTTIFNAVDDIIKAYKAGKKVLVVLNTVRRAQNMYNTLKGQARTILFHSRFTMKDKRAKEKAVIEARENHILVATQVVEVSLNIDYDVLFTEAAYFDSLVQRAGRINRFNKKKVGEVYIYRAEANHPYLKTFLDQTYTILENELRSYASEWDYVRMTNMFYNGVWDKIKQNEENRYKRIWNHLSYIFAADLSDIEVQKLLKTRSGVISIPAYPYCFKEKIQSLNEQIFEIKVEIRKLRNVLESKKLEIKRLNLIEKKKAYLVNVPIFYYDHIERDQYGEYYVNLEYSSEEGLTDKLDNMI